MKAMHYGFLIALAILAIVFCERNKSVPQSPSDSQNAELVYLFFQDHGCAAVSAKSLNLFDSPRLLRHEMDEDTLTLTFYFWANCCPVFQDSVSIASDCVSIFLTELEQGCWCTCPFENDFVFTWNQEEQLHIRFLAETSCYEDDPATVDTIIVIR
jgi:hypothetical protein